MMPLGRSESATSISAGGLDGFNPAPPLPKRPRPITTNRPLGLTPGLYGMGSPFGSSLGGYPFSPYMNGLGGLGGLGTGSYQSDMVRAAEAGTRAAFQPVENIVHAVASVSLMLTSTYQALFNSFQAVIGVAEHFTRMKDQLSEACSNLAPIRFLRWLWHKLLVLLRIRSQQELDTMWTETMKSAVESGVTPGVSEERKSAWPSIIFLLITFGGPYLLWRLMSSLYSQAVVTTEHLWAQGKENYYIAVGLHDFTAENDDELSFRKGQKIIVAPKDKQPTTANSGWVLASVDGKKVGAVPYNYIKVIRRAAPEEKANDDLDLTSVWSIDELGSNTVGGK